MNLGDQMLAKRYATAFLNLYGTALVRKDYDALEGVCTFLKKHPGLKTYFKFPRMHQEKKKVLEELFNNFSVPSALAKLTDLLAEQQRLYMLKDVLDALVSLFFKRKKLMKFTITSSHGLKVKQLDSLKTFLEKKTGLTVVASERLDNKLIVGVRVLSSEYLWQHSVAQQLRDAERVLHR